ncbi:DUF4912 domain-containing protein [Defluviicoccus vanus]|uniref:DUF4912 domain-containing protein n=1 Tax=Defluviicoccus vanus TaxID=111831 RepID=A0A7H1N476_9PROT|nr:DUF4912 domain-containing protein [Defluviicoccus vanus]
MLLDVDPRHLHAFWNIPPDQIARMRSEVAAFDEDPPLVLRIAEVSPQGKSSGAFDIEVIGLQGQFYVDIWDDARRYQGTIGLRLPDGALATLAPLNVIDLPRGGVSDDNTWREIALPAPPATAAAARTPGPHAPSITPAAAAPSTSPSVLPSPAVANESLPVASRAVAAHTQPTVVTPPIAAEMTATAVMPPAVATAVPATGFGAPLLLVCKGQQACPASTAANRCRRCRQRTRPSLPRNRCRQRRRRSSIRSRSLPMRLPPPSPGTKPKPSLRSRPSPITSRRLPKPRRRYCRARSILAQPPTVATMRRPPQPSRLLLPAKVRRRYRCRSRTCWRSPALPSPADRWSSRSTPNCTSSGEPSPA